MAHSLAHSEHAASGSVGATFQTRPSSCLPGSLQTTQARHSEVHTHPLCLKHPHTLPCEHRLGGRRTRTPGHATLRTHAFTRAPTSHARAHTRPLSPADPGARARRAGTRAALGPAVGDGPAARPPPLPRPRGPVPLGPGLRPLTGAAGSAAGGGRARGAGAGRSGGSYRSWRRRGHTLARSLFRRRLCGPRARALPPLPAAGPRRPLRSCARATQAWGAPGLLPHPWSAGPLHAPENFGGLSRGAPPLSETG